MENSWRKSLIYRVIGSYSHKDCRLPSSHPEAGCGLRHGNWLRHEVARSVALDDAELRHGPQLMAEIGDVRRFAHKGSLTAFAGVDPGANQSGTYEAKSTRSSKRGSPELRKTLFVLMTVLLQKAPPDNPVFQFLDKKRAEGKHYHVYMTAGCNKFLRIYDGKVKEFMNTLDAPADMDSTGLSR